MCVILPSPLTKSSLLSQNHTIREQKSILRKMRDSNPHTLADTRFQDGGDSQLLFNLPMTAVGFDPQGLFRQEFI